MTKNASAILTLAAMALLLNGCAASQKSFYAAPQKIGDTQLCRTILEEAQARGATQFARDAAAEAQRRQLTEQECIDKVNTETGVLVATALVATAVGVGIACQNGCSAPSGAGAYRPNYAGVTDVDCLGGSGDGPRYTPNYGPFPINPYNDPYDLDRDGDGMACELGE